MAGVHSGDKRLIFYLYPLAVFVPCNNHYFNLVSVCGAHVNINGTIFVGTVEHLFDYFCSR
jgi:hypothetical protein